MQDALHIDLLRLDPLTLQEPRLIRRADPDDPTIGIQVRTGWATYAAVSEPHTMADCPYWRFHLMYPAE